MGLGADILFGEKRGFQKSFRNWQRLAFLARFWPSRENRRKLEMLERMPLSGMGGEGNPALHLQLAMTHDGEHAFLAKRLFGRLSKVKNVADRAFLADCLLQFCNRTPWLVQRHERMGMAASIEMRMPFLDNDMLDFAINLPRRAKRHRRHGKWVVKQAAHPVLPRDAVFTRKTGFAVPSNYHAGTEGLLVGGMLAEQFGWTPATTSAIVSELAQETNLKFFVVGLELWLRLYIGNENAEELGERLIAHAASPS